MTSAITGRARKRILLVQYAGDMRGAYAKLQETGRESYYGHRYLFEQLERMQRELGDVAIMCCMSGEAYQEALPNGVTVIGAAMDPRKDAPAIIRLIEEYDPTHLVMLGPLAAIIRWGCDTGRRMMCQMADSFNLSALRRWLRYGRIGALLNRPEIEWVANHGRNACQSLIRIGVDRRKVLAWDWPYVRRPGETPPKAGIVGGVTPVLLYVGLILRSKGIGDAIAAVALLKSRGLDVVLHIAGAGEVERFQKMAERKGVSDRVVFLGLIPNTTVFERMREAALVLVPSRHSYPEGMPLTIYEALTARTPIVASDHPMFVGNLVDGESAAIYPAGDAKAMADRIGGLLTDQDRYARLSHNSDAAWQRLQNPVKWGETLYHWVKDEEEDRAWLAARTVAALGG